MTKKNFIERCSYHKYTGASNKDNNVNALFFDWQETEKGRGYKFCAYARAVNATKEELIDALYKTVTQDIDTPWWINLVIAQNDSERFKVPLSGNALYNLRIVNPA